MHSVFPAIDKRLDRYLTEAQPPLLAAVSDQTIQVARLGVRSGGEGGTTPALAAVINAIVDALFELGVRHIEMSATPSARLARDPSRARRPSGLLCAYRQSSRT